jgi:peroxiredoxin
MLAASLLPLLLLAAEPDFELSALNGATVKYADLKGANLTVVAFVSIKCPVSQAYQARMNRFYRDYSGKGVGFAFVDANANESAAEIELYVKQARLAFPVYKDYRNRAADFFDAQTTPEMYVLDASGTVRYRGAIDDAVTEARVKTHGLRDALDALLDGKAPRVTELKAFGCVLKRAKGTS